MDIQYLIVYAVVAVAAAYLLKRFMPQPKKKKAGASCSACSACEPADPKATPQWMAGKSQ